MSGILFMFASTLIRTLLRTSLIVLRPCLCEGFLFQIFSARKPLFYCGLYFYLKIFV